MTTSTAPCCTSKADAPVRVKKPQAYLKPETSCLICYCCYCSTYLPGETVSPGYNYRSCVQLHGLHVFMTWDFLLMSSG